MKNWKSNLFTKVFNDVTSQGNKIPQKTFLKPGKIPVIDQGQDFIAGYSNDNSLVWKSDLPVIIFGDHTRAIKYVNFPFILGADGVKVLQPIKEILPLFAYYWLLYIDIPSENYSRHFKFLKELIIKYPPLEEQKRIAKILSKCDRIRRTRQYSLQLSDTYLQSVFLEMFGDPVTNPKGWKIGTLGDVIVSAKDGPHVSPVYSDSGIPFLSTRNVRKGELIWEDLKFISFEDAKIHWKKCKPERGDILYTKGGTTGLAKAVDFDKEIAVWVHIAVLKLQQDRVISTWLESMLNTDFCYKQSQELTFGIVNRDLGLQRMPKIKIYIPPLPLQEKFAQIVQKHERFRTQQREAQRQAEHLFQTLLHHAFRGELTSSDSNEVDISALSAEA